MKIKYLAAVILIVLNGCASFSSDPDTTDENDTIMTDQGGQNDTIIDNGVTDLFTDKGGEDTGNLTDQGGDVTPDTAKDTSKDDYRDNAPDSDQDSTDDVELSVDSGQDAEGPRGIISVIPYLIDFGYVPLAGQAKVPFEVKNIGEGALRLDKFVTTGPTSMVLNVGFEPQASGLKTTYLVDPPKNLKPGATFKGEVVFTPTEATEAYTEIRVFSSDRDYPDGFLVHAMGNKTRPAVEADPESVDFGAAVLGEPINELVTLTSIGGMNVRITGVYPDQDALDAGFRVEFPGQEPSVGAPVTLAPLGELDVRIVYDPTTASPVDSLGRPQTESGQIVVSGDMFTGSLFIRVTGLAVEGACTMPVVELLNEYNEDGDGCPVDPEYPAEDKNTRICRTEDGWEVPTGTLLRLSGAQSFSPFGSVTQWNWTVTQPADNVGAFIPSATEVEPMFMVGAVPDTEGGEPAYYELFLDVTDSLGNQRCEPKSIKITTREEVKADVLLTWQPVNPFDPVPPHMGQDVDLHFTHMKAADDGDEPDIDGDGVGDDWFDLPYDCFWYYPEPAKDLWGQASPWVNDLVILRNDSDDGVEPEFLTMGLECPNGRPFKVGAHFFDDHDYGPADVTVRVYARGRLLYTATQRLESLDMWYVGDLKCKTDGLLKTAEFIPNTTKPIAHDYLNTEFGNP